MGLDDDTLNALLLHCEDACHELERELLECSFFIRDDLANPSRDRCVETITLATAADKIVGSLSKIEERVRDQYNSTYCYACRDHNARLTYVLRDWKEILFTKQSGVCLDCGKRDRRMARDQSCRVSHTKE